MAYRSATHGEFSNLERPHQEREYENVVCICSFSVIRFCILPGRRSGRYELGGKSSRATDSTIGTSTVSGGNCPPERHGDHSTHLGFPQERRPHELQDFHSRGSKVNRNRDPAEHLC